MGRNRKRILAALSLAGFALLGSLIRSGQLNNIFDETGLPLAGHPLTWMLGILTVLWIGFGVLLARLLPKGAPAVQPCKVQFAVQCAAGMLVLTGAAVGLIGQIRVQPMHYKTALYFLQLLAALCIFAAAWQQWQGKRPASGFFAVVCLWQLLVLLLNFRSWSVDPTILDYCFRQLALVSGMCAAYHAGALGLEAKGRRMAGFWCLTGGYFAVVSVFGEGLGWCLSEAGMALWLAVFVWQLFAEEKE